MHEQVQTMLSAYLDNELTQADTQRVRLHLEDCEDCRDAFRQLQQLRHLTADMTFVDPQEDKMNELQQRLSVRAPLRAGWGFLLAGVLGWIAYALFLLFTNPPAMTPENLIVGAIFVGLALLLVAAVRRRWLELPGDRYRGVKK